MPHDGTFRGTHDQGRHGRSHAAEYHILLAADIVRCDSSGLVYKLSHWPTQCDLYLTSSLCKCTLIPVEIVMRQLTTTLLAPSIKVVACMLMFRSKAKAVARMRTTISHSVVGVVG